MSAALEAELAELQLRLDRYQDDLPRVQAEYDALGDQLSPYIKGRKKDGPMTTEEAMLWHRWRSRGDECRGLYAAISRVNEKIRYLRHPDVVARWVAEEQRKRDRRGGDVAEGQDRPKRSSGSGSSRASKRNVEVPKTLQDELIEAFSSGKGGVVICRDLESRGVPNPYGTEWRTYQARRIVLDALGLKSWDEFRTSKPLARKSATKSAGRAGAASPRQAKQETQNRGELPEGESGQKRSRRSSTAKPAPRKKEATTERKTTKPAPKKPAEKKSSPRQRPAAKKKDVTPLSKSAQASGTSRGGTGTRKSSSPAPKKRRGR